MNREIKHDALSPVIERCTEYYGLGEGEPQPTLTGTGGPPVRGIRSLPGCEEEDVGGGEKWTNRQQAERDGSSSRSTLLESEVSARGGGGE